MAGILIRRDDGKWTVPAEHSVTSEDELQALLAASPELLPGPEDIPRVAVREFPVASGYIDLIAVDADGSVSIVECKLRANPEIRRQVLGQVLAYAAALWETPFEHFEADFERRAGRSLASHVELSLEGEFDADELRRSVAANLRTGSFRVVVAVDEITDELKRTILYLNQATSDRLEILALEVNLLRDGNIEVLIPSVYGEEAADRKREARRPRWDGEAFWEHAEAASSEAVLDVIRQLHAWAVGYHASFYWGAGKRHPSMTAWIRVGEQDAPVWSCYLDDDDRSVLGLNFEWLLSRVGEDPLRQLAADLAAIPGIVPLLQGLEQAGYRKRPSAPIAGVLTAPDSLAALMSAYDRLISS